MIDPVKDVDGCTTANKSLLASSDVSSLNAIHIPCAAMAMFHFLQSYSIDAMNKSAVIVGRSELVGIPCHTLLQKVGCNCGFIDKSTVHPEQIASKADILVTAVGCPGLVRGEWLKPGCCIIDIGTTCVKNKWGKCRSDEEE